MEIHVEGHSTGDTTELKGARSVARSKLDDGDEDGGLDGGDVLCEFAFKDARLYTLDKVITQLV